MTTTLRGKVSWFGGPKDTGVKPDEGLAFIYSVDMKPELFLPYQPEGTTGLARRLNPDKFFIACRWDYDEISKTDLLGIEVRVHAPSTGKTFIAVPADWGPHESTDRVADISRGLMDALGIETDDEVEVTFPFGEGQQPGAMPMPYKSIAISSGHGKYVRGASGIIDEVDEARRVVEALVVELRSRGVEVEMFHDDVSKTQSENLDRIVAWHNDQERALDVSVHFNAFEQREQPVGTEVLYVTQAALAGQVSAAIAECGFINRGAKKRTDLAFLNGTDEPAILLEICFVDSEADCDIYGDQFDNIADAIATVLGGSGEVDEEQPPTTAPAPVTPRVDIEVSGEVLIFINGEQVGTKG